MLPPGPFSETARQVVHIAAGSVALLLPVIPWWQGAVIAASAIVVNIHLLRRLAGGRLHRPTEAGRPPAGLVLYPTAVLLLLLFFPSRPDIVAAAWGVLAAGDGAATLVGRRFGRTRWPWNRSKSVAGTVALFLAGGAAGAFLAWWCRPAVTPPPYLWFSLGAPFAAALVAAAVETVPIRLDDNLSVSLSAGTVLWALALVNEDLALGALLAAPAALALAVPANVLAAGLGYAARGVSPSGAVAGAAIGTVVFLSAGWRGWVLLLAAFACAAGTSRLGLRRKSVLGIHQEAGGRRGAASAIANTGIAAAAAVLSVVSYAHVGGLIAFAAALTAGASDTIASEIGKAWGRRTWSIVPAAPVRPGTPGAVSAEGSAAGLIGAGALASLAAAMGVVPQHAVPAVVAGAAAGALVESLLAAAFEPAGILNNDSLNLINTGVAAYVAVVLAF